MSRLPRATMNSDLASPAASTPPTEHRPRLGELLVARNLIGARELDQALAAQARMGDLLGRVLVRLGLVSETDLVAALAQQLGVAQIRSDALPDAAVPVAGLSPQWLCAHRIIPLACGDNTLSVAMATPQDGFLIQALRLASGLRVHALIATESDIDTALEKLYRSTEADADTPDETGLRNVDDSEFVEHLRDLASEAPVIRLVNRIIGRVVDLRASDIHLEPFEDGLHVRYRVDGVLREPEIEDAALAAAATSRIKLLARLDIAERRLPQDGRIRSRVKGHELDLRISTLPTVHGESVVMRVLDRANIRTRLEHMGFADDTLAHVRDLVRRPHGIVLVTGPTGSGKTTTLYAALAQLDASRHKILTVEDPVEYQLEGVNQVQVQPAIGMSFAHALRSILRQDPDIIMIGEMRDTETARIAVQAALTGHLVLSTLHTNTAAAAVVRLEDMGLERYLIMSTINGVLAQRLVRRLCPHCRRPATIPSDTLQRSGIERMIPPGKTLYTADGCTQCRHTGYLGRSAIHELFVLDAETRRAVLAGADARSRHEAARAAGMRTLYEDGLRKVVAGETSLEEVMRVVQDHDDA